MRMRVVVFICAAAVSATALAGQSLTPPRAGGISDQKTIPVAVDPVAADDASSTPDNEVASEWLRVSHRARSATTIQTAIGMLQKFVDENGSLAGSEDAVATLAHYKEIATAGAIKFQGKWMSAAEKDAVIKAWRTAAQAAIEAYHDNSWQKALTEARKVLEKDKGNPDAMTIAGISAEKLAMAGPSRTYFTSLAAAEDSSPLPENNLGVLAFRQKQYAEALSHFYKAMQINSGHRVLVDNVAVALHVYADNKGDTSNLIYINLKKMFPDAENTLEAKMAADGMASFGGTWLPQADANKDQAALD